ncbi:hypothetical protein RIF29_38218 [Crotalaria pallida]|uniref:ATPase AAA-type core domain-containing protein n=1 Tax=Crotalaria pallida TaxID=3830 RepID=A0AAN9HPH6_CROPI
MCGLTNDFELLQRFEMRGEVGGVSSGSSKRKRSVVRECEVKDQRNIQVDSNFEYNGSGSGSQPEVHYRRPRRVDLIRMTEPWRSLQTPLSGGVLLSLEHAPSIIFMDEIDSIGSDWMESGSGNGDSEHTPLPPLPDTNVETK